MFVLLVQNKKHAQHPHYKQVRVKQWSLINIISLLCQRSARCLQKSKWFSYPHKAKETHILISLQLNQDHLDLYIHFGAPVTAIHSSFHLKCEMHNKIRWISIATYNVVIALQVYNLLRNRSASSIYFVVLTKYDWKLQIFITFCNFFHIFVILCSILSYTAVFLKLFVTRHTFAQFSWNPPKNRLKFLEMD